MSTTTDIEAVTNREKISLQGIEPRLFIISHDSEVGSISVRKLKETSNGMMFILITTKMCSLLQKILEGQENRCDDKKKRPCFLLRYGK
jgi:hypothetical protein